MLKILTAGKIYFIILVLYTAMFNNIQNSLKLQAESVSIKPFQFWTKRYFLFGRKLQQSDVCRRS